MPGISDPGYELARAARERGAGGGGRAGAIGGDDGRGSLGAACGPLRLPRLPAAQVAGAAQGAADRRRVAVVAGRLRGAAASAGRAAGHARHAGATATVAVCREMTKLHEEVYRGTVSDAPGPLRRSAGRVHAGGGGRAGRGGESVGGRGAGGAAAASGGRVPGTGVGGAGGRGHGVGAPGAVPDVAGPAVDPGEAVARGQRRRKLPSAADGAASAGATAGRRGGRGATGRDGLRRRREGAFPAASRTRDSTLPSATRCGSRRRGRRCS